MSSPIVSFCVLLSSSHLPLFTSHLSLSPLPSIPLFTSCPFISFLLLHFISYFFCFLHLFCLFNLLLSSSPFVLSCPRVSFLPHLLSSPCHLPSHWITADPSNTPFQQPWCSAWKRGKEKEEGKKSSDMSEGKKNRESNAKLKAFSKALETAGNPGGSLKNLPWETVKEKVWQCVCGMLCIYKEQLFDSFVTLVSACFSAFSPTWFDFVLSSFQIMPYVYSLCFLLQNFCLATEGRDLNSP